MRVNLKRAIINPVILITLGSLLGMSPALVGKDTFIHYKSFREIGEDYTNKLYLLYILGIISFSIGYIFSKYFIKKKQNKFKYNKVKRKTIVIFVCLLGLVLLINIKQYGGIPLLNILRGMNISRVNQIQAEQNSGIFGIQVMLVYTLIILFLPFQLQKIKGVKKLKKLYIIHLGIILFAITYTGKRQFIFIVLTTIFSYLWLFLVNNNEKRLIMKVKKSFNNFLIISLILFSSIGVIRERKKGFQVSSIIKPIASYASLPYMNLSNIIKKSEENPYKDSMLALKDTILGGFPSKFRMENKSLKIIPRVEKTSPNTVYGAIFWNFRYKGIIAFMLLLGIVIGRIYRKAINNDEKYMTIYSLTVWPLLSIHTYNHFLNLMYWVLPVLIVNLLELYKRFYLKLGGKK